MILCLLLLAAGVSPVVPLGPSILVNGFVGVDEWRGALGLPLDPEVELKAREDSRYLYLAVVFKGARHTGLDLYLTTRDGRAMLHVSSALGERAMEDNHPSKAGPIEDTHPAAIKDTHALTHALELVWGRNCWWTANPVCVTWEDGKQAVVAPEAFEFQLDRARLGREVALLIHLKRPDKTLPAGASPDVPDHWLRLKLEK
ncbi:MAG: hypothetical protein KA419_12340 [Acidobacteria bacterium]|nr:hypothetical protein [Acidobacteriota bacterium]